MSNNNAFQASQLSQYFSRSSPQSQGTHRTDADLNPSTKVSRTDCNNPPQGYTFITRLVKNNFASPNHVQLLVPLKVEAELKEEIKLEQERRMALAIQEELEFERGLLQTGLANTASDGKKVATNANTTLAKPDFNEFMLHQELVAGTDFDPKRQHPVYAFDAVGNLTTRSALNTPDKDVRARDAVLIKKMNALGSLRDIAMPKDIVQALDTLRLSQPHFAAVIELIRGQLLLGARSNKIVRIPPILLDGAPGFGKTHFAMELAKALGTTIKRISFDSAVTSATLMGSERRWGNTQFGAVFEQICLGQYANPIIVLDEIDKFDNRQDWNPLAPLHSLLEPSTAKCVRDISVDFEFDASLITWIATSNRKHLLPDSLRSRFREFEIVRPNAQEAIQLATAVVAKSFIDMQLTDFKPPDKQMVVALAHLTAREITQILEKAIARALDQGRNRLILADLPADIRADDVDEDPNATDDKGQTGSDKNWLH